MNFRRSELVELNGSFIRTYLDETGEVVMVDVKDLLEKIGISREEEGERLSQEEDLIRKCCLVTDFCYHQGIKSVSLFVPLYHLNDYLYSLKATRPDVQGNLQEFRTWLAIQVNNHWSRIRNSVASMDSLDIRELMLRESHYELAVATKGLDLDWVSDWVTKTTLGMVVPVSMMSGKERDLLHLARGLAIDVIQFSLNHGYDDEQLKSSLQNTFQKYIFLWEF